MSFFILTPLNLLINPYDILMKKDEKGVRFFYGSIYLINAHKQFEENALGLINRF